MARPCNKCDGTGEVECDECGGEGMAADGSGPCKECGGILSKMHLVVSSGKVDCGCCDGSGEHDDED